jgi:hypothetical protein
MTAYYFRALDEEGSPNGWIGFVMAEDRKQLLWAIDEFIDPYSVEIKTAYNAGYCYRIDQDGDYVAAKDYEISELEPMIDDSGWRKPNWDGIFNKTHVNTNYETKDNTST